MQQVRKVFFQYVRAFNACLVLKWIHGCGWVHRDLSVGNLYWYRGRGLIGDFEYAKRRNSDAEHERRAVGSSFFSQQCLSTAKIL